jgi:hypothetical protein
MLCVPEVKQSNLVELERLSFAVANRDYYLTKGDAAALFDKSAYHQLSNRQLWLGLSELGESRKDFCVFDDSPDRSKVAPCR